MHVGTHQTVKLILSGRPPNSKTLRSLSLTLISIYLSCLMCCSRRVVLHTFCLSLFRQVPIPVGLDTIVVAIHVLTDLEPIHSCFNTVDHVAIFGLGVVGTGWPSDCIGSTCVGCICARYSFAIARVSEQVPGMPFYCRILTFFARISRASLL